MPSNLEIKQPAIIDELVYFYYKYDEFQTNYIQLEKAQEVYCWLLEHGRIDYAVDADSGILLGYSESFKLDYETLGKILCGINVYKDLDAYELSNGNIAYVSNITIHPDYRGGWVAKELTKKFFRSNIDCDYFCGQANRKKHQPFKMFNKTDAIKKWANKEN